MIKRVVALIFSAIAVVMLSHASASAGIESYQLVLNKGRNFVSLPLSVTATDGSNSIYNIFGRALDKIESVEYFDASAGEWRIYAAALPGAQDLVVIPNAAGFYVDAKEPLVITVYGTRSDFLAPAISAGWNAVGVAQPVSVQAFSAGVAGFSIDHDRMYRLDEKGAAVALHSTDVLTPGQGYWLDNDPDRDGVTTSDELALYGSSPGLYDLVKNAEGKFVKKTGEDAGTPPRGESTKVDYLAEQCAQIYSASSAKSLDQLYDECRQWVSEHPDFPIPWQDQFLGGFRITKVRYKADAFGKKVAGIGILQPTDIPESLKPLFSLNKEQAVFLDLKEEKVVRAVVEAPTGFTIGGSGGPTFNKENAKLDLLTVDSDGLLETGITAVFDSLPERTYFVRWFPPRKKGDDSNTNFIQLTLLLGDEDAPGDELTASRIWYQDKGTKTVLSLETGEKKWHVNLPPTAAGVFEPSVTVGSDTILIATSSSPFSYSDPAEDTLRLKYQGMEEWPSFEQYKAPKFTWLAAKAAVDADGNITFTGTVDKLRQLSGIGNLPDRENQTLIADEKGRIYTTGVDPSWGFEKGAGFFSVREQNLKATIKGWKRVYGAKGVKWSPTVTLYLGYTSASVLKEASLSASVAPADLVKLIQSGLKDLKELNKANLEGKAALDAKLVLNFEGYETGVNAGMAVKQQKYYSTATEQRMRKSIDEFLKFSPIQSADLDISFTGLIHQQYILPRSSSSGTAAGTGQSSSAGAVREGFQENIRLVGEGRYRLAADIPVVGGKDISARYKGTIEYEGADSQGKVSYQAGTSISMGVAESFDNPRSDENGWSFSVEELRIDFEKVTITGVNGSKEAILRYMTPSRPKGIRKISGYVTLSPPENFIAPGPFAATLSAEKVPQKDPNTPAVWRGFFSADLDLNIPLEGESNYLTLKQLMGMKQGASQWGAMILSELHLGDRVIAGTLIYDAGSYTFIAQGCRLDETFERVDVAVTLTKGKDQKWQWSAAVGGSVSGRAIATLLGQDGSLVTSDLLFRGTLTSTKIVAQVENLPLNWGGLPEWITLEKVRNITYTRERNGSGSADWSFNFEMDVIFRHFTDGLPPEQWPRFTMGGFYSPQGLMISGRNLGPIDMGDGAQLTIVEASGGFGGEYEGAGKSPKVRGTVSVKLSDDWLNAAARYQIPLPQNVSASFAYSKGGFLARVVMTEKTIDIGGGAGIKVKEMVFKKASPWASGLGSTLTIGGNNIEGIVELGEKPRFVSTDRKSKVTIDLTGGYKIALSNLAVDLGSGFALSGDVVVTMPEGNVLRGVVGKSFSATLSGSAQSYSFSTDTHISSRMDMGLLGKGSFTITSLSLSSDGAFAGSGTLTLKGVKTAFVIGTNGGGTYFLADFGEKGVDAKLAQIFTLKIKKSIGLEAAGPYQYLRVDDLKTGLGDKLAGADLASQRFLYFLPSSVPPVGFAFFDNLDGKVHIAGFAVNVGMSFPAPKQEDLGPVVTVLGTALTGGKVDWTALDKLSAPSFGLRDVSLNLPKVPGYAWKDGRIQHTDNVFAAIFGKDRLDIVKTASLKPKNLVEVLTANSPMDVIKVVVPADKRKGNVNVDLLGFKTAISYDLRADELLYEKKSVKNLPGMYAYISKLLYVDQNAGELPEELKQGEGPAGAGATAGRSKTVGVPMPKEHGGGNAQVTWKVEDITADLNDIKQMVSAITPPQGTKWEDHLKIVWNHLSQKGLAFNGNRAVFRYSPTVTAELELTEYDGSFDITGLKYVNNKLYARFGTTTLYTEKNFEGKSLTITDDVPFSVLRSSPIGNDNLSSIKIEGRGKVIAYQHADYSGNTTEITGSLDTFEDSKVKDNDVSCLKTYYDISQDRVTGWRLIFKSDKGIVTTVDAGGVEVIFPGDSRALSLLPNGRLLNAVDDTKKVLNNLKPYPMITSNPTGFIASVWENKVLPRKAHYIDTAADDDVEVSERPVEFRRADGSIIGFLPLKYGEDKKVGGLKFDKKTGMLSGKFGKVTLYEHANYLGKSLVVEDDIPDLGETTLGNDSASSIKVEDGAVATLYSDTKYKERFYYDYTTIKAQHSGMCLDVAGNGKQSGANIHQWDCNGGNNQSWKLVPKEGWYALMPKHSGKCADVSGGSQANGANVIQWDCHGGSNQHWKLTSVGGNAYTLRNHHSGKCLDVAGGGTHRGANVQQWDCVDVGQQKWLMDLNKTGFLATSFEKETGWLGDQVIGNDTTRSVKVYNPLDINQVKEWKVLQSTPTGGNVILAYVKDANDGQNKSLISTELKGTGNNILSYYDESGKLSVTVYAASGAEFPFANYRIYVKGTPYELNDITEASQYVRIVTKTVKLPDGTTAVINEDGGISAQYKGVAISPAEEAPSTTVFTLPGPDGMTLRFNITKAGGFAAAEIAGSEPLQYAPLYEDESGVPQGIKKVVGKIEGGFFVDAGLNLGTAQTVQVNLHVSGSIKTDGNYYLKGNGDLVIATYEVSEAVIELSSEKGLMIRGNMDFYGTKVVIEGSLTPDNKFSFTGVTQVMISGNGIKGTLGVNNSGVNINGGVFLANKKVTGGVFAVKDGKVSWKTNVSIGFAGFDSTTWIQLKNPYGPGYSGRAYINLDVPIYIWGPKGWKCKRVWGVKVCWPKGWGNIRVGTLPLHYNQAVSGSLSGSALNLKLGPAALSVDVAKPSVKASW